MSKKPAIKRLFWDIETSLCKGYFWRCGWKQTIGPEQLEEESKIICVSYKWEHQKKPKHLVWEFGNRGDDAFLCEEFVKIAKSADELVAHNGDRFDIKQFNTRCLMNDVDPGPIPKTVDTLVIARRRFAMQSNRLDYIAKKLLGEGKSPTSYQWWKDITDFNCRKSLASMVKYCDRDTEILERVYHRLAPYHNAKTHAGVAAGREKWSCDKCSSENVRKERTRLSAKGTHTHVMKCKDCGGYHTISNRALEDYKSWKLEKANKERKKK